MPPKKAGTKEAAKQKVMEDKTFGLKNKNKSSKVQKYVQQLQSSQRPSAKEVRLAEPSRKEKKKAEEERQRELDMLFHMTIKQPKVPEGVDPKTIVCEFFRHGKCTKGFKCKFSHDLSIERKGPKASVYDDMRGSGAGKTLEDEEGSSMADWDQETLEKAIAEKHAAENRNRPTEIVCRYFLDAVEKKLYGWLWQCPNGKNCKYRHALPPGYVLKSQMKELLEAEAAARPSVEETIEEERAKVDALTPITDDVFRKWRDAKERARLAAQADAEAERRSRGQLTGREIFEEEGFAAVDDAGASDRSAFAREVDEDAEFAKVAEDAARREREAREAAGRDAAAAEPAATLGGGGGGGDGAAAGPSSVAAGTLTQEEADELFDDSDDDDVLDALAAEVEKKAAL